MLMREEVSQQTGALGKLLLGDKTWDRLKQPPSPQTLSLTLFPSHLCSLPPSRSVSRLEAGAATLSPSTTRCLRSRTWFLHRTGVPSAWGTHRGSQGPATPRSPCPVVWHGMSVLGSCRPPGSYLPPAGLALLSCTLRGDIINSPVGTLHWIPTFSVW